MTAAISPESGLSDVAALELLIGDGAVVELRVPVRSGRVISGYFGDRAKLAGAAQSLSGRHPGIYFTVNPVNPALLARRSNRVEDWAKETTSDPDVARRRWLVIDLDPKRPSGIASTDEEHEAAIARAREIHEHLKALGWPAPVAMDSGNGAYLLYKIDLPNDDASRLLVTRCLKALAFVFDDDQVHVDTGMFNAARIIRVPGTLNAKGDDTPERPHRLARIISKTPAPVEVTPEQLAALAALVPTEPDPPASAGRNGHRIYPPASIDVEAFVREHLEVAREGSWGTNDRRWVLARCPFNSDHVDRSAWVAQFASGAVAAGCQHNSCTWTWADLRTRFAPKSAPEAPGGGGRDAQPAPVEAAQPEPPARELPPFPTEVLPDAARRYVEVLAESGIPLEFLGPTALVALAAALGGSVELVVKPGSWTEWPVLWAILIGRRGTKKSPALANVRRPFDQISASWSARFRQELDLWESLKKADQKERPRPLHQRLTADDTTLEALARTLEANHDGVLVASDEGRALIDGLGQYKHNKSGDRARFLSLWNSAPLVVDRVSTGHVFVERPIVNIVSGIQPELLSTLDGPDGLRERFLVSRFEGAAVVLEDLRSAEEEAAGWAQLVDQLVGGRRQRRQVHFATRAAEAFVGYQRQYAAEQGSTETPDHVEGWLSKAPSQLARIALTLVCARHSAAEILDENDLAAAARVVGYFAAHVRALPASGENLILPRHQRDLDQAVEALAAFARRSPNRRVTRRDVQRAHVAGARTPGEVEQLIARYGECFPGCVVPAEASGNPTVEVHAPGHQPQAASK